MHAALVSICTCQQMDGLVALREHSVVLQQSVPRYKGRLMRMQQHVQEVTICSQNSKFWATLLAGNSAHEVNQLCLDSRGCTNFCFCVDLECNYTSVSYACKGANLKLLCPEISCTEQ